MKMKNGVVGAVVLGAMLATTGCVKIWRDSLDVKTYMVEASRELQPQDAPLAPKLWIDAVSVLPPYNVRNFVLRESDVSFGTSYYSELLLSPSENFHNAFFLWFSDCGVFENVSIVNRNGMSHRLTVTVIKFYSDRSSEDAHAVLAIKATLFDEKTKGVRVLFTKNYSQQISIGQGAADDLIRAYNQGLSNILAACEVDMIEALK